MRLLIFSPGTCQTSSIALGNPDRQVFVNTFSFFAQDSWQLSPKLNVNYGLRWDYEGPLHNSWKNLSVFRPNLGGVVYPGEPDQFSVRPDLHELQSSRWRFLTRQLRIRVVRAGVGLYFDTPNLNPFLDNRPGNGAPNGVEGNPGQAGYSDHRNARTVTRSNMGSMCFLRVAGFKQYFLHRQELRSVAQPELQPPA